MFIGHIPAAYLLGRIAVRCLSVSTSKIDQRFLIPVILIGGIFPDIDLVYFYTIGGRKIVHHAYWSHIPFYWGSFYVTVAVVLLALKKYSELTLLSVFILGVLLHLVLDSIVGQIQWLFPMSTRGITLVIVPARYKWWVLNFLIHWTFLLEIFIVILSAVFYVKQRKT